jgi:hypothetical protein
MLCGAVAPLVLTAFTDLPGVLLGVGAVTLFFLSLRRLNRQMVAVKRREPNLVLDLCMRAYQQVRDEPTSEVLQRQVSVLNAAEALEKRAESSVIP